jgi:gp16 family phage-associated protein
MSNTTAERRKKAKEIMSKHGLTLKEWAKRNGVSVNLVNAVINNKTVDTGLKLTPHYS